MHYDLINQRVSQKALNMPYLGPFLSSLSTKLPTGVVDVIANKQISSIWGPVETEAAEKQKEEDTNAIKLLNRFNGGLNVAYKTISYLKDR